MRSEALRLYPLQDDMGFNENDVNRDQGGRFDTKAGSAAEVSFFLYRVN